MKSINNKPITYGHLLTGLKILVLIALWCFAFWIIYKIHEQHDETVFNNGKYAAYPEAFRAGYDTGLAVYEQNKTKCDRWTMYEQQHGRITGIYCSYYAPTPQ